MTEEQLVARCREGDREAQGDLYALTSDRIYRLLLRMTGRPDDAFDLAQDTYLKVFASIDQFKGDSGLTTWIYRIALNEARQHLRRRRIADAKLKIVKEMREYATAVEPDPTALVDMREALNRLPVAERTMIVLRHFDQLSYDEMAQLLEKAPGTIASALNRARRMLRDLLQEDSPAVVKNPAPESI